MSMQQTDRPPRDTNTHKKMLRLRYLKCTVNSRTDFNNVIFMVQAIFCCKKAASSFSHSLLSEVGWDPNLELIPGVISTRNFVKEITINVPGMHANAYRLYSTYRAIKGKHQGSSKEISDGLHGVVCHMSKVLPKYIYMYPAKLFASIYVGFCFGRCSMI